LAKSISIAICHYKWFTKVDHQELMLHLAFAYRVEKLFVCV